MLAKVAHALAGFVALLLLFIAGTALARTNTPTLEKLTSQQCTLPRVIDVLTLQSLNRTEPIHKNQIKTLEELKQLNSKATDDNKPIGEQLSIEDSEKFSSAAQRSKTMNMALLVESRFQRDLNVIQKLTVIADNYYRWNKLPDENGSDAIYVALLIAWRESMNPKGLDNNSDHCDLDYALYRIEQEPIGKLNSMSSKLNMGVAHVMEIYKKYPTKEMNYDILNDADKKEVASIRDQIIAPSKHELMYIHDLENIRHFAKISELMSETYSKDILNSGGDIDSVGTTIKQMIKEGKLTKEDEKMLAAWQVVNEKIPSDVIKDFEKIKSILPKSDKK
jgi:hypothetical protein